MKNRLIITALGLLTLIGTVEARDVNILFIGNSFTFRHNLPELVKQVFEEGQPDLTVNVERVVYGGQDMFRHSTYYFSQSFIEQSTITDETITGRIKKMEGLLDLKTSLGILNNIQGAIRNHQKLLKNNSKTRWDYIVLQSWKDVHPSLDEGYAKYAAKLSDIAKTQRTKVILYITAPNIQNSKPVKEPQLQERVDREMKLAHKLAKKINAFAVVPVPLAINMIQQGGTDLTFCYVHDFHPNQYAAYLTSNMFYASFFKKSTEGFKYNTVIETNPKGKGVGKDPDGGDAKVVFGDTTKILLQKAAFDAVMEFNAGYGK